MKRNQCVHNMNSVKRNEENIGEKTYEMWKM